MCHTHRTHTKTHTIATCVCIVCVFAGAWFQEKPRRGTPSTALPVLLPMRRRRVHGLVPPETAAAAAWDEEDAILFNLLSKEALRRVRNSDAALPKFMKVCRASLASLGPGGPGILAMTLYASKTLKTLHLDTCSAAVIHAVAESLKENTVLGHLRSGLEDLK